MQVFTKRYYFSLHNNIIYLYYIFLHNYFCMRYNGYSYGLLLVATHKGETLCRLHYYYYLPIYLVQFQLV